jgi:inosine/xanthosine triphosphatase
MKKKIITVTSTNPVKLLAAELGFKKMFPEDDFEVQSVIVSSGVHNQPVGDEETLLGATNRAQCARLRYPDSDYWVGIEGGIDEKEGEMSAFAWVFVIGRQMAGKGKSGTFYLPPKVAAIVRQGKELGEADDIVYGRSNSKQENGAIGLLTDDVIDRAALYETAVILALVPFKNPNLYS